MRAWAVAVALVATACGGAVTELVVVVDTDVDGAEVLRVTTVQSNGTRRVAVADLADRAPPRTLVLVHRGGALGPVDLTVDALDRDGELLLSVQRRARFTWGRSLRLHVFLAAQCRDVACEPGQTCGNDAECRSPLLTPCDLGAPCDPDAGALVPEAGSPCEPIGEICGVRARHLPGDRVAPRSCVPLAGATASGVRGPEGSDLAATDGAFVLTASGVYEVRVRLEVDPSCASTRLVEVVGPTSVPDATGVSSDALRDLDARVGAAFIAGRRGAFMVDRAGWTALRPIVTGDALPEDLRAVVVHGGHAVFGPHGDDGFVYRVRADGPLASAASERVALPSGSREVRALEVRLDRAGPVLAATKDGAVLVEGLEGLPTARQVGPTYDPSTSGWAALGAHEPGGWGAIWLGDDDEIANRSTTGGVAFNDESAAPLPTWLESGRAAVMDDRDPARPRLWLCGDHGVAVWDLDAGWGARSTLPPPSHIWSGPCHDVAVGDDGDAWVAAGEGGLVRLDPEARVTVVYGSEAGFPVGAGADRVAFASDGALREVWVLDRTARSVHALSAHAPRSDSSP